MTRRRDIKHGTKTAVTKARVAAALESARPPTMSRQTVVDRLAETVIANDLFAMATLEPVQATPSVRTRAATACAISSVRERLRQALAAGGRLAIPLDERRRHVAALDNAVLLVYPFSPGEVDPRADDPDGPAARAGRPP